MNWLWVNIPLEAVFFLAMTGIPLWIVIRHPDCRPAPAAAAGEGVTAQAGNGTVAGMAGWPAVAPTICDRRELVGASASDRD